MVVNEEKVKFLVASLAAVLEELISELDMKPKKSKKKSKKKKESFDINAYEPDYEEED